MFNLSLGANRWLPATAEIKNSRILVSATGINKPVAVRYAWEGFPACNLYNKEGLPAVPFRTDSFHIEEPKESRK